MTTRYAGAVFDAHFHVDSRFALLPNRGYLPKPFTVDDYLARVQPLNCLVGWHTELYLDAANLPSLESVLSRLPQIVLDHLGMRDDPGRALLRLVERGAVVTAFGLGRIRHPDPASGAQAVLSANPAGVVFGTDLPSTRAWVAYCHHHLDTILGWLDPTQVEAVTHLNPQRLYRARPQNR